MIFLTYPCFFARNELTNTYLSEPERDIRNAHKLLRDVTESILHDKSVMFLALHKAKLSERHALMMEMHLSQCVLCRAILCAVELVLPRYAARRGEANVTTGVCSNQKAKFAAARQRFEKAETIEEKMVAAPRGCAILSRATTAKTLVFGGSKRLGIG